MKVSKSAITKAVLCSAIAANVVLGVGVFVAYHAGYQSGVQSGVDIGSSLADGDETDPPFVSSDGVFAGGGEVTTPEPTETPPTPSANVSFVKSGTEKYGYLVTVRADEMESADEVRVIPNRGDCAPCEMTTEGAYVTVLGLEPGDTIIVVATLDGRQAVIGTYTVNADRERTTWKTQEPLPVKTPAHNEMETTNETTTPDETSTATPTTNW